MGSNLGVVELTVALHYIFNTPHDKILWDVGHQVGYLIASISFPLATCTSVFNLFCFCLFDKSYPHKILTGRRGKMKTIRQTNGLSGYTKRRESEHDSFGTGHSSTTLSAGLGHTCYFLVSQENKKNHFPNMHAEIVNQGWL